MKKALITGVTGQDGSYMAELLLEKGYHVFGLQRRTSTPNTERIDHIYDNPAYKNFITIYGDLTDSSNLSSVISKIEPDEIYNLGAQSHVKVSFQVPEYTANVTALGTLRLLEAMRQLKSPSKFYQASSSEMFGQADPTKLQNEQTVFNPQSPYGLSKVFSYYITKIYRDSYTMFASNGILFNHESPRRGITFVTRKITIGLSRVKLGMQGVLKLGNLDSRRDWGYAKDYVEGIYRILQYKEPEDFVLATGQTHTVREFVELAAKNLNMSIGWTGAGIHEKGIDKKTGKTLIEIDEDYFRPQEVDYLQGDDSKARRLLGWKPKVTFEKLVELMVKSDYDAVKLERKTGKKIAVRTIA
jgi:GDPmannose 4,6-dehydratase